MYDVENNPCKLTVNVIWHDCPEMDQIPLKPTEPVHPGPSGGEVFGIIVLILFLVILAAFIGGFFYNYVVRGKRGVDAIPFAERCRQGVSFSLFITRF